MRDDATAPDMDEGTGRSRDASEEPPRGRPHERPHENPALAPARLHRPQPDGAGGTSRRRPQHPQGRAGGDGRPQLQAPGGPDAGAAPGPAGSAGGPRPAASGDRPLRGRRGDGSPRPGGGGDAGRSPCPGGVRPVERGWVGPGPLRQAPLVPAGAPGPATGRGGCRLRDDRPERPPGLGRLGQPRRQHPAVWRHQQGPQALAADLRPPDHLAGLGPWGTGAYWTTCW